MKKSRHRIKNNLFLHIHSATIHQYSLRWNYTFGLGVIALSLFLILCLTGFLLMIYYKPDTANAYYSIKDIIYVIPSGRLVRNIHRWSAHLMVIACFLHMVRVFYTSAYKRGRGLNWNIGICLFLLTLGLSFTGYLLPWDQLAFWACTIGVNITASITQLTDAIGLTAILDPGAVMKHLLLGSDQIGNDALVRFYVYHCIFLPLLLTMGVGWHIWRIRKSGGLARPDSTEMTNQISPAKSNLVKTYPDAIAYEFSILLFVLAITIAISYFYDAPLKEPANLLVPENPAKAPWYFLGVQELVSYSAFTGGIGIPLIIVFTLSMIPYLDKEDRNFGLWFGNKADLLIVISSLGYSMICCITLLGLSCRFNWPGIWFADNSKFLIHFINPGTLLIFLYSIWALTILRKSRSVRSGVIAFFTCFFLATIILTYFAWGHRGPNWDFYWWPLSWQIH